MATRVFIPIPRSQIVDLKTGEVRPEWYLFFSRTIGGSTLTDAEILASMAMNSPADVAGVRNLANDAQLLAQLALPHRQEPAPDMTPATQNERADAQIAELRKEIAELRAMISAMPDRRIPHPTSRAAARVTMRI